MEIVNYLDVSLNLNDSSYKPYHKPDNEIYILKDLNYPPNILKQIQTSSEKRISTLSSNETIFKACVCCFLSSFYFFHQVIALQKL